jgi:Ser/Thr protein kinase RdoA (MazF antagonist)
MLFFAVVVTLKENAMTVWSVSAPEAAALIRNVLKDWYSFEAANIYQSTVANTNTVYLACAYSGQQNLVLRQLRVDPSKGIESEKLAHIDFEYSVLRHLAEKGFPYTAKMLQNAAGKTVTEFQGEYLVAFSELEGEPIGSFNDMSRLTVPFFEQFCLRAGEMSRLLKDGRLTYTFGESIASVASSAQKRFTQGAQAIALRGKDGAPGREFLQDCKHAVEIFFEKVTSANSTCGFDARPKQAVHRDLHLGNALFNGLKFTGFVDFDWCGIDCTLVDLASLLLMCAVEYGGENDGQAREELFISGLRAFQAGNCETDCEVIEERMLLRAALDSYAVFQFLFTVDAYAAAPTKENLIDLRHFGRVMLNNDWYSLIDKGLDYAI